MRRVGASAWLPAPWRTRGRWSGLCGTVHCPRLLACLVTPLHRRTAALATADGAADDPQLTVERFARSAAQQSRMGLAMPDEFLPLEDAAGGPAASAPGRLILRVEGGPEAEAFLAAYAAPAEEGQPAAEAPAGVPVPASCPACGTAAGSGFEAAVRSAAPGFIRDCVIVGASCSSCTAASAEVRSTGGVAPQGSRLR